MTGWNALLNGGETNSLHRVESSMSMIFCNRQFLSRGNLKTDTA